MGRTMELAIGLALVGMLAGPALVTMASTSAFGSLVLVIAGLVALAIVALIVSGRTRSRLRSGIRSARQSGPRSGGRSDRE